MMNCFAPFSPGSPPSKTSYKCRASSSARSFAFSLSRYATTSEESASFAGSLTMRILAASDHQTVRSRVIYYIFQESLRIRKALLQLPTGDDLVLSRLQDADFRSDRPELLGEENLVSELFNIFV